MSEEQTVEQQAPKAKPTREELEQQIKQNPHSPEDSAAAFFMKNQNLLRNAVNAMSSKQLRRFLYNLVSYPHVETGKEVKSQLEKEALHVANEMVMNKAVMQLAFELGKAEEAMKKEDAKTQQLLETEIAKGATNV